MKCPICGKNNFDINNFCFNCGFCLDSSEKSLKRMKRDKVQYIAVISLLAAICIALVVFIGVYGIRYVKLVSNEKTLTSQVEALSEKNAELESLVYVPDDWSYVCHKYGECTAFNSESTCYVMTLEEAEAIGCTQCPYCFDD